MSGVQAHSGAAPASSGEVANATASRSKRTKTPSIKIVENSLPPPTKKGASKKATDTEVLKPVPPEKTIAKKAPAKKTPAKKAPPKKAPAKKPPARKSAPKKASAPKKSTTKAVKAEKTDEYELTDLDLDLLGENSDTESEKDTVEDAEEAKNLLLEAQAKVDSAEVPLMPDSDADTNEVNAMETTTNGAGGKKKIVRFSLSDDVVWQINDIKSPRVVDGEDHDVEINNEGDSNGEVAMDGDVAGKTNGEVSNANKTCGVVRSSFANSVILGDRRLESEDGEHY